MFRGTERGKPCQIMDVWRVLPFQNKKSLEVFFRKLLTMKTDYFMRNWPHSFCDMFRRRKILIRKHCPLPDSILKPHI